MIALGFEVGTGRPVEIPLAHTVVTGLTQHAGKTTAIEALLARSGLRAVCFVTKRGEIGFHAYRRIPPYFRERADWQYVQSLLEATMRERMRFERAWIMRACKGATTLAGVHEHVRRLLKGARGIHENVYTALDHYLQLVVPQVQAGGFADTLQIEAGLNLMVLTDFSSEMQALVIRAVVERVLEAERGVVVVLPEAWEFLPERRGSPVKAAAEALLRQGAVLENFVWLDSQDIAGVDKRYLKGCGVWLLGCQPEANEAEHTLRQIPLPRSAKPDISAIQGLPRGHFFACWGNQALKVYVQPSWMGVGLAQMVALGNVPVEEVRPEKLLKWSAKSAKAQPEPTVEPDPKEVEAVCERCPQLEKEVERLNALVGVRGDLIATHEKQIAQLRASLDTSQGLVVELRGSLDASQGLVAKWRERAEAGAELDKALMRFVQKGQTAQASVDEIVEKVLARLPAPDRPGAPLVVAPAEKLRRDFQEDEARRIRAAIAGLKPLQRRALLLLEATPGYVGQKILAERLGRSTKGGSWVDLTVAIRDLKAAGFVEVEERQGARARLREKIGADLGFYEAAAEEIEQVYQVVMAELAAGPAE